MSKQARNSALVSLMFGCMRHEGRYRTELASIQYLRFVDYFKVVSRSSNRELPKGAISESGCEV